MDWINNPIAMNPVTTNSVTVNPVTVNPVTTSSLYDKHVIQGGFIPIRSDIVKTEH